jgi:hypothetical protein
MPFPHRLRALASVFWYQRFWHQHASPASTPPTARVRQASAKPNLLRTSPTRMGTTRNHRPKAQLMAQSLMHRQPPRASTHHGPRVQPSVHGNVTADRTLLRSRHVPNLVQRRATMLASLGPTPQAAPKKTSPKPSLHPSSGSIRMYCCGATR